MPKEKEDKLCFVQFLHPGGEHAPDDRRLKRWNESDHRRKFLLSPGRCMSDEGHFEGEVAFWGEWEPESEVVKEFDESLPGGPRYLYRPYYVPKRSYARLQNTDPFVFQEFFYGICQQHKSTGPTQLRNLKRGSVILFGSSLNDVFVLDTVFVVAEAIDHDRTTYVATLGQRVPREYMEVTVRPMYSKLNTCEPGCTSDEPRSYRLYSGATHSAPVEGMFSYFPCRPRGQGRLDFARPSVRLDGVIKGTMRQGHKLNSRERIAEGAELWKKVMRQILGQGLWLGTEAHMPDRRDS